MGWGGVVKGVVGGVWRVAMVEGVGDRLIEAMESDGKELGW